MDKLKEFNALEDMLTKAGIEYDREDKEPVMRIWDFHQLRSKDTCGDQYVWDVICHKGSYGYEQGLLEMWGKSMSDSLEEKVNYILEDSDFNDLPYEERVRIGRYKAEQQILDLYQILNQYEDVTTESWRKKIRLWLKNCVDDYYSEYRYPTKDEGHTDQSGLMSAT